MDINSVFLCGKKDSNHLAIKKTLFLRELKNEENF